MSDVRGNVLHQSGLRPVVCQALLSAEYRFAKTMPENPHWYTLRKTWADDAAFVQAVKFIREFGYIEVYKGSKYTMYNLNGYKYWTMGAPINKPNGEPCTILINRAKIHKPVDYDKIAESYDSLFADQDSRLEEAEIFSKMRVAFSEDRILDIGCGTGLFLQHCGSIPYPNYVGVDPSAQMLGQLVTRFPEYRGNICHGRIEDFYDAKGFDCIVSHFGAMNYVEPSTLPQIMEMLRPNGTAFLMFYQDSYTPVTYQKCGVSFEHHQTSEYDLSKFRITEHRDTFLIAELTN